MWRCSSLKCIVLSLKCIANFHGLYSCPRLKWQNALCCTVKSPTVLYEINESLDERATLLIMDIHIGSMAAGMLFSVKIKHPLQTVG